MHWYHEREGERGHLKWGTTRADVKKRHEGRNKEGSLAGDSDYTPAPAMSPALNLALPPVFKVATLASACDSSAMVNQASRLSVRLFPQISVVGAKHSLFFKKKIPFFLTLNSIVGHTRLPGATFLLLQSLQ